LKYFSISWDSIFISWHSATFVSTPGVKLMEVIMKHNSVHKIISINAGELWRIGKYNSTWKNNSSKYINDNDGDNDDDDDGDKNKTAIKCIQFFSLFSYFGKWSRLMRSRWCLWVCVCMCPCIPLSLLGNGSVETLPQ
jgi:hypothetical protein